MRNKLNTLGKEIDIATSKEKRLTDEVNSTKQALQELGNQKTNTLGNEIDKATASMEKMKTAVKQSKQDSAGFAKDWQDKGSKIGGVFSSLGDKVAGFGNRIMRLATSAFIFNIISAGFREMSRGIQELISKDNQLNASMQAVRANLMTAFYPIYQAILPALRALGQALAWITGQLASFIAMLTGTSVKANQQGAKAMAVQTAGLGKQAKGYDKVGKSAKKAAGELASFDKIEVLKQKDKDASGGSGGGGASNGGAITPEIMKGFDSNNLTLIDKIREAFERLKKPFENMNLGPLREQFARLWEILQRFGGKIGEGLWWFYENVLAPLAVWTISEVLPRFLNILSNALEAIEPILDQVGEDLIWLWDNFLKPASEWVGSKITEFLDWLGDCIKELGKAIKSNKLVLEFISGFLIGLGAVAVAVGLWSLVSALWGVVAATVAWTVALLANPITWIIAGIAALIAIIIVCVKHWDEIKEAAQKAWNYIKDVWGNIGKWFDEKVSQPLSKVWDNVTASWKGAINGIIGMFEGFINKVIGGLNLLTGALSKIGFDIPDWMGGGRFGINIPQIPKVSLPRLEQGAVLKGGNPFLAWVNDQPRGQTNVETPLSTMIEAFRQAGGSGNPNIVIEASGDFSQFIRLLNFKLKEEDLRVGQSFVTGDSFV